MKRGQAFLFVPLACVSLTFSAMPPQQQPSTQEWRQTERTDPVHGDYARYTMVGKFLRVPPGDTATRPSLVLDCSTLIPGTMARLLYANSEVGYSPGVNAL